MTFLGLFALALGIWCAGSDIGTGLTNIAKAIERKAVRDGR